MMSIWISADALMENREKDKKKSRIGQYIERRQSQNRAVIIPYLFIAYPLAGIIIGMWLDTRFKTSPLFLLIFLVAGFAEGVREMMQIAKSVEKDMDEEEELKKKDFKDKYG
jgi:F0F1-type ATP synthase assembly protein I